MKLIYKYKKLFLAGLILVIGSLIFITNSIQKKLTLSAGPTLPAYVNQEFTIEELVQEGAEELIEENGNQDLFQSVEFTSEEDTDLKLMCGSTVPSMIILVIGSDSDGGYINGLADIIKIIRLDFVDAQVQVLSIPRDIWIDIPRLAEKNIFEGKINQAYFYGNLYFGEGDGPGLLAETLYQNFLLPTDHYIAVNMQIFVNFIDAIGGIELDLKEGVYDVNREKYYSSGINYLNGESALHFARIRNPEGDVDRTRRQNLILMAVFTKLTDAKNISRIPDLISLFFNNILTDFGVTDIPVLSCMFANTRENNIKFFEISEQMLTISTIDSAWGRTWVLIPDKELITGYLDGFVNGYFP